MSQQDEDDYWDDYSTPFRYEANMAAADMERRELANQAVNQAIEAYYKQPWYKTLASKIRFGLFWFTYKLRLRIALFIIGTFGADDDLRFAQKVFFRLGV